MERGGETRVASSAAGGDSEPGLVVVQDCWPEGRTVAWRAVALVCVAGAAVFGPDPAWAVALGGVSAIWLTCFVVRLRHTPDQPSNALRAAIACLATGGMVVAAIALFAG